MNLRMPSVSGLLSASGSLVIGGSSSLYFVSGGVPLRSTYGYSSCCPPGNGPATLDEVSTNLREAVALHLEGENLAEIGLAALPSIIVTFELEASPAPASAA